MSVSFTKTPSMLQKHHTYLSCYKDFQTFLHLAKVCVDLVYATQLPNDFLYAPRLHEYLTCVKDFYKDFL